MKLEDLKVCRYLLIDGRFEASEPSLTVWIERHTVGKDIHAWVIGRERSALDKTLLYFERWDKVIDCIFKTAQEALDFWNENRDKIDTGDYV